MSFNFQSRLWPLVTEKWLKIHRHISIIAFFAHIEITVLEVCRMFVRGTQRRFPPKYIDNAF